MCISGKHDNCVSQGEQFISVVVLLTIRLEKGKGELPDNSFDLLGLPGQSEFAEQRPESFIELLIGKVEQFAIGMQHVQDLFVIFAEVLAQYNLVDALNLDDVFGDGVGGIFVDEALGYVVIDC